MNRNKLAVILAAIIIPGGFIALLSAYLLKVASRTESGRRTLELARARMESARSRIPAWMTTPILPSRQAAA